MRIGIPKEPAGQTLVSASPDTVGKLIKLGLAHRKNSDFRAGKDGVESDQNNLDQQ